MVLGQLDRKGYARAPEKKRRSINWRRSERAGGAGRSSWRDRPGGGGRLRPVTSELQRKNPCVSNSRYVLPHLLCARRIARPSGFWEGEQVEEVAGEVGAAGRRRPVVCRAVTLACNLPPVLALRTRAHFC